MTARSSTSARRSQHALVVGGGISGLSTALALSDHFETVTLLERDTYPETFEVRPHTPHGAHVHVLLASGLQVMSRLVPQLTTWLDELGVEPRDLTRHIRFCYGGTWMPRTDSGIPFRPCTRTVVEQLLLRAVRLRDNVEIRAGCKVTGLERDTNGVISVTAIDPSGATQSLSADWTTLAMGRGASKLPQWMETMVGEAVREDVVDAGVSYTSITVRLPEKPDWSAIVDVSKFPDQPEMSVIIETEGNEAIASFVGYGRQKPPKSYQEMIERSAALSTNVVADLMRDAEPLDEIRTYSNTANRRRYWAELSDWPEALTIVGDGTCSLNPRYGQGMTVALLGAELLQRMLGERRERGDDLRGLAREYQRALDKSLTVPWQVALMEDRLWEAKFDGRELTLLERVMASGSKRALDTAFTDIDTYQRFMRVAHLIETPLHLAHPMTIARIAFPQLRKAG